MAQLSFFAFIAILYYSQRFPHYYYYYSSSFVWRVSFDLSLVLLALFFEAENTLISSADVKYVIPGVVGKRGVQLFSATTSKVY